MFILVANLSQGFSQLNNPYPNSESGAEIYYSKFSERPKYLDPARSYSSDEYDFLCQIYEPVVQYHYLKRPYQLIPATAESIPTCIYYDKNGNKLSDNATANTVAKAVYTIKLKKGTMYQKHPCFAKNNSGEPLYHNVSKDDISSVSDLFDFSQTGTRELHAKDYIYQIKRMADPRLQCPIFGVVNAEYISGMKKFAKELNSKLQSERAERKKNAGIFYNREENEKQDPINIDYHKLNCEGLKVIDQYTFEITLNQKYPQFIYWLSMPFFSPMPWEAITFYNQEAMIDKSITLNWYPVGTGPYRMEEYNPNHRIVLVANENFRDEYYPSEGMPGDEKHLLDKGKKLPLIPKAIFSKEKEASSLWRKFLQGYYDASGISSENFSKVMNLSSPDANLSDDMSGKEIRLETSVSTSIIYMGFNMLDPVIGGLEEKKCKLRQAISIAIDQEEHLEIYRNGRGIVAQGPIPPGIFGHKDGINGINTYTHNWDKKNNRPKRRSLDDAKKLLTEAGYPDGIGADGRNLTISYETIDSPGRASEFTWLKKQLAAINIDLKIDATDYNRFREKMMNGKSQLFGWGWNADYPDPENFLFLLYGKNSKVKYHGENAANYNNPKYDNLFDKMKTMINSPERDAIITEMVEILRHDSPWQFGYIPVSYGLYHAWFKNLKPNKMSNNSLKYYSIDTAKRNDYREINNKPKLGIVFIITMLLLVILIPGIIKVIRSESN